MTKPQPGKPDSSITPSTKGLEQRLASLSSEKLAALQRRIQRKKRSGFEPIRASADQEFYPLSLHQIRLWFIEQLYPGTPLYNNTRAIRIRGPLDCRAIRSALQSLLDRHEALRTTYHMVDHQPAQRINATSELPLPIIDLRMAGEKDCVSQELLQQQLTSEGRRLFDLSAGRMLRAALFQLADEEHVLQLTIHHLACDGWSFRVLFDELAVLYAGLCTGTPAELGPVGLRYVDFALWQQSQQSGMYAEGIQWWKHQLADAPTSLELPTDRPRPQFPSGSGAFQPLVIPPELLEQLEGLRRQENCTVYMTLLAGFFILLHRYSGMEDFLVGSVVAGRQRPETHGIVGFFVDTVALRANLAGEPTVRQVLQRVRQTVIDAIRYSDVPFDHVVHSLQLPRDLSRHPLFQVVFNAPPQYSLTLHDLSVSTVDIDLQVSRFDLDMTYSDKHNRTTGVNWNTELFDSETIASMLTNYRMLLKGMSANPDRPIRQLPLMTKQTATA